MPMKGVSTKQEGPFPKAANGITHLKLLPWATQQARTRLHTETPSQGKAKQSKADNTSNAGVLWK